MKEVYLLSGLGADKRVFDSLDLSGYKVIHIEWITPLPDEPIEHYAERLLIQISAPQPILIGVSFGGIVAVEIAKLKKVERVIQVSSAKTRADIPTHYLLAGYLRISSLIPVKLFKMVNRFTYWFFGTETEQERILLKKIITETDDTFLKWAIGQITIWKNQTFIKNSTTIHGNQDRILPMREVDFKIDRGGHFMIVNRAKEISSIIQNLIG